MIENFFSVEIVNCSSYTIGILFHSVKLLLNMVKNTFCSRGRQLRVWYQNDGQNKPGISNLLPLRGRAQ